MQNVSLRQREGLMGFQDILPITYLHLLYFATHLLALSVFWLDFSWFGVGLCLTSCLIRLFGSVAGYHRYFSHRAFKTSRLFQFILGFQGCLSGEHGPLWWAQKHPIYHRYTDTPKDLHSPYYQGLIYFKILKLVL